MDEQQERQLRRKALRLRLSGTPLVKVLKIVGRSKAWFNKWAKRFERFGVAGLKSGSRCPHHQPQVLTTAVVRMIVRIRQRLMRQTVGLIGPRAIQREFEQLGGSVPSQTSIKRVLRQHGLVPPPPASSYFPRPLRVVDGVLHAMDWTCRYLEDGIKVYAFHTLNLRTRACTQTIAADKQGATVTVHLLQTWQTLRIPAFLQLDNDAAFCGGYKTPRRIGHMVRRCLYLGIELIFLPVAEPDCNGEVEELNGLWSRAFWQRRRFTSLRHVQRTSPQFIQWYATCYGPPALTGQTPTQAQRREHSRRLTPAQVRHLPSPLPITAGHIHFIRRVQANGTITILSETWKVGQRLAGQYVWATVTTHRHRLDIWYQRSAQADWHLIKTFGYALPEPVKRLKLEFKRPVNQ
jgi:putative transposase